VFWFNGSDYVSVYPCIRYNRIMSRGKGPDVGGSGAVGYFGGPSRKVQEFILEPLRGMLRKVGFKGMLVADLGLRNDSFVVRRLTPRHNPALASLLFENTTASPSNVFMSMVEPMSQGIKPLDLWAVSLLVSVPPFPTLSKTAITVIENIHPKALKHLWPIDMTKIGEEWRSAGMSGKLLYITARGSHINEAVKRVYRTAGNLAIPDAQYRDDIGDNAQQLFRQAEEWRWIR
jgi:phosphoribosylamine-glycine ligase